MPDYDDILSAGRGKELAEFLGDENVFGKKHRWTKEKIVSYLRADGRCEYCGADVLSSCEAFWGSDWEHIVPRKKDGGEEFDWENIAVACRRCNTLKGRHLPPGVSAEELAAMERHNRINAFKLLVLGARKEDHTARVFGAFRELVEIARCAMTSS
jgi:hypothetical protein